MFEMLVTIGCNLIVTIVFSMSAVKILRNMIVFFFWGLATILIIILARGHKDEYDS